MTENRTIDRRTLLKNLGLVIGGTILLPSCLRSDDTASIRLKHLTISGSQEKLLAEVAETIIPKTNTPGAKDLSLHLFVMKMVDDCYGTADQKSFENGISLLDAEAEKTHDKPFVQCSKSQREALLNSIDTKLQLSKQNKTETAGADTRNDLFAFFEIMKGNTVLGYTNSKYFMTKQVVYELIPGRYNAHFSVTNKSVVKNG
ncbi:gluconate 2-dehydrogenase subunit 3 family protein [Pedobacter sp. HMF7647]|uniref:Gluconate 2-dehydrogenase subunit 3 family protein n=1 Tax=Hufsiella arboris TaxID=2695275 RepID=A0A7K1Y848_9SPHI|nr:gluconate 2-dehydrogenase subunit 3 family protein [Hufsiella arboris]MXV50600.1 gluconate 2-dehydrogenase subunit 3 family protein [Hufsiella arboris]